MHYELSDCNAEPPRRYGCERKQEFESSHRYENFNDVHIQLVQTDRELELKTVSEYI